MNPLMNPLLHFNILIIFEAIMARSEYLSTVIYTTLSKTLALIYCFFRSIRLP